MKVLLHEAKQMGQAQETYFNTALLIRKTQ